MMVRTTWCVCEFDSLAGRFDGCGRGMNPVENDQNESLSETLDSLGFGFTYC
jgi:hypothetical protein